LLLDEDFSTAAALEVDFSELEDSSPEVEDFPFEAEDFSFEDELAEDSFDEDEDKRVDLSLDDFAFCDEEL
jgi:hypothetical protein